MFLEKFRQNRGGITAAMMFLYFLIGAAQYIGYNYLPIYIDSLPFATNSTVGYAIALGAIATMLFQPLWGSIADRAKSKNFILLIGLICVSAVTLLFLLPQKSIVTLLICVIIFYTFFLVPQTLVDTITVESIEKVGRPFSTMRAFLSAGAAGMAFLFSLIHNMTDQKAFLLMSGGFLLAIIPMTLMPIARGHAHEAKGKKASYADLLKNKRLMLLFAYAFFLFISSNIFSTYFPVYYSTERGLGAGTDMLGAYMAIAIVIEAVLMIAGGRFMARFNAYTVFIAVAVVGVVRGVLAFAITDIHVMFIGAIFQALFYAPLWASVTPFINRIVPDELKASGQSAWTIVAFGIAPAVGNILAGVLADVFGGLKSLFLFTGLLCLAISVVFFFLFHRQRRIDEQNEA